MEFLLHSFLDKHLVVLACLLYALLVVLDKLLVQLAVVELIREGFIV